MTFLKISIIIIITVLLTSYITSTPVEVNENKQKLEELQRIYRASPNSSIPYYRLNDQGEIIRLTIPIKRNTAYEYVLIFSPTPQICKRDIYLTDDADCVDYNQANEKRRNLYDQHYNNLVTLCGKNIFGKKQTITKIKALMYQLIVKFKNI